jgi:hypothetical protein
VDKNVNFSAWRAWWHYPTRQTVTRRALWWQFTPMG